MSFEDFYEPGNGTRYHIMATEIKRQDGTEGLLLALMNSSGSGGTCIYVADHMSRVSLAYVAEKMKLREADAKVMADYINENYKDIITLTVTKEGRELYEERREK